MIILLAHVSSIFRVLVFSWKVSTQEVFEEHRPWFADRGKGLSPQRMHGSGVFNIQREVFQFIFQFCSEWSISQE